MRRPSYRASAMAVTMALILPLPALAADVPAPLEAAMRTVMQRHHIPGASLAVMKDGRLVVAKGYGVADTHPRQPVRPATLFRIGSTSKPITAMAVCKLVETGKLSLDAKVFDLLDHLKPLPGATVDPRLATISVRHLLQHRGGWDTAVAGDSLGTAYDAAKEMGISYPPSVPSLIRYWMGKPLNFDPGSRYSYTNLGYLILGQVIEKVSGQTYEDYVKATMLWPMGIRGMQIGRTLWEERGIGESRYFDAPGGKPDESAFAGLGRAQLAYGGFHQPMGLSSGGWVASSPDLLRWVRGVFGTGRQSGYLKPQTLALVAADPGVPGSLKSGEHYGLGWVIAKKTPGGGSWHHTGAIYGSCLSHVERRADGLAFAVTMNSLPHDYGKAIDDLLPRLRSAVDQVRRWPDGDLFGKVSSL